VLDGLAATLAARHATSAEVATLREILTRQANTPADDTATLARLNEQFHNLVYAAARNPYLRDAAGALKSSLALLPGTTYSSPNRPTEALRQHQELVDAIADHQDELAGQIARDHMRAAEQIRLLMLADDPYPTLMPD
jgi:DNA-binding GntR family transcriptional regulator